MVLREGSVPYVKFEVLAEAKRSELRRKYTVTDLYVS
jgi:hypothetical protein